MELNIYQAPKYNLEARIGSTLERKTLGANDIVTDSLRFTYEKIGQTRSVMGASFL